MLGLCLYVPVSNSDPVEVEYFESNGLPSELKSVFNKLSVFLPSQEFSTYQRWRKVRTKYPTLIYFNSLRALDSIYYYLLIKIQLLGPALKPVFTRSRKA